MATRPKMEVSLGVSGDLDLEALTRAAGTKPTKSTSKSERPAALLARGPAFDSWVLEGGPQGSLDSSVLLESICKRIMGREGAFAQAVQAMGADYVLSYYVEVDCRTVGDIQLRWPYGQLAFASVLGAPIDIDFYYYDEAECIAESNGWAEPVRPEIKRSRLRWTLVVTGGALDCGAVTSATGLEPMFTSPTEWRCDGSWVYGREPMEYWNSCKLPHRGDVSEGTQVGACAEMMLRWRMGVEQRMALKQMVLEGGVEATMVLQVVLGSPGDDVVLHLSHGLVSAMCEAGVGARIEFC